MATWGGWFMVKYFAICAPYACAGFDDVVIDSSAAASDFG
jgi:hypothetical protein